MVPALVRKPRRSRFRYRGSFEIALCKTRSEMSRPFPDVSDTQRAAFEKVATECTARPFDSVDEMFHELHKESGEQISVGLINNNVDLALSNC